MQVIGSGWRLWRGFVRSVSDAGRREGGREGGTHTHTHRVTETESTVWRGVIISQMRRHQEHRLNVRKICLCV